MADRIANLEERAAETIHALEQRLAGLERLFWAHKHPPSCGVMEPRQ
jgi:hypothetical protein